MTSTADNIVLIPGLGNTALIWQHQVEALSDFGRVFVPDYRGSESIDAMADSVLDLVPDDDLSLVGFSLGGYIALNIVSRFASRLSRLALISSSPYADNDVTTEQRRRLIEVAGVDYNKLLADMGQFIVSPDGPNAAHARETLITMGEDLGAAEFCRQQEATMVRPDCTQMLAGIDLPTQVLCGEKDIVTPVSGNQFLADHIPGATLEIVEGAGHLLPLESPARVTRFLINWLTAEDTPK